jgi:hypothetical protein
MFTTIKALRASHAMTSRVNTVDNWLKRQNPEWKPEDKFPIFAIANSNVVDDVEWVFNVTSTHAKWPAMEKAVLAQFGHKNAEEHEEFIVRALRNGKAKALAEITPKYNAAYLAVFPQVAVQADALPTTQLENGEGAVAIAPPTAANPTVDLANTSTTDLAGGAAEEAPARSDAIQGGAKNNPPLDLVNLAGVAAPTTPNFEVLGAFYVAIGRIIRNKQKSFDEAVKYASSPTGSRLFTEYVGDLADPKDVRAYLRDHIAKL